MIEHIRAQFQSHFGGTRDLSVVMAPGRVNLIGEYTDFNDGFVLPMTVDRGVYIGIQPRSDNHVAIISLKFNETVTFDLGTFEQPKAGHWSCYVLGVVEELRLLGLIPSGFEAVIDGNLNLGAGLSSSAAVETAAALALQTIFKFTMPRTDIAALCQRVEHRYTGVMCGIMDQFASGLGRADHALMLDCRSLSYVDIPVTLGDHRILIISSEVKRELASSAYNERRAQCEEGVALFKEYDPSVRALRDVTLEQVNAHASELSDIVGRRCSHVVSENMRVLNASAALGAGDLEEFGSLMNASHQSLREDFEVSCDELDCLVDIAQRTDGVLGSRMTGAGFGGCTVTLIHSDAIDSLKARLAEYEARFALKPGVFILTDNLQAGVVG